MSLKSRLQTWWVQMFRCAHHWHAGGGMIDWGCCWCGKNTDGRPKDQSRACNRALD